MQQQVAHPSTGAQLREPAIILGNADLARLRAIVARRLDGRDHRAAERLEAELDRAIVVPQAVVPPEIVTMDSRIVFRDVGAGRSRVITLCQPDEADPATGRISILAPVATALLGLGVGDSIDWPMPGGMNVRLQVTSIVHRPEAAGDVAH